MKEKMYSIFKNPYTFFYFESTKLIQNYWSIDDLIKKNDVPPTNNAEPAIFFAVVPSRVDTMNQ